MSRSPRARTLRHMDQLLAGVGVSLVASCGSSYGVVDPMPPPAVCPSAGRTIAASASFVKDPSGDLLLAVRVDPPGNPEITYLDAEPYVSGGKLVSKGRLGTSLELRLKVTEGTGASSVTLDVPIHCKAGNDGVTISLSWTTMAEGAPVSAAVDVAR